MQAHANIFEPGYLVPERVASCWCIRHGGVFGVRGFYIVTSVLYLYLGRHAMGRGRQSRHVCTSALGMCYHVHVLMQFYEDTRLAYFSVDARTWAAVRASGRAAIFSAAARLKIDKAIK